MGLTIEDASTQLREKGFYRVKDMVVIHHLMKDFTDFDVVEARFYIKPAGEDFVHVALVVHDTGRLLSWEPHMEHPEAHVLQVRYTCAGDDLLYGLHIKFNSAASLDPAKDLEEIITLFQYIPKKHRPLAVYSAVRNHPRYIRKRFRHGRIKAKIRAFFQMLKDNWRWWKQ